MKAIQTRYAGCHFRSRLEARWAVFLDHLGIAWEYEPEGFEIGPSNGDGPSRRYLPDFLLPGEQTWVEVKGDETAFDWSLIAQAVIPHGGGLPGSRLLLLGPIPRCHHTHRRLSFHKGDVLTGYVEFEYGRLIEPTPKVGVVGSDADDVIRWPRGADPFGFDHVPGPPFTAAEEGYTAARSARFEHGESGAT